MEDMQLKYVNNNYNANFDNLANSWGETEVGLRIMQFINTKEAFLLWNINHMEKCSPQFDSVDNYIADLNKAFDGQGLNYPIRYHKGNVTNNLNEFRQEMEKSFLDWKFGRRFNVGGPSTWSGTSSIGNNQNNQLNDESLYTASYNNWLCTAECRAYEKFFNLVKDNVKLLVRSVKKQEIPQYLENMNRDFSMRNIPVRAKWSNNRIRFTGKNRFYIGKKNEWTERLFLSDPNTNNVGNVSQANNSGGNNNNSNLTGNSNTLNSIKDEYSFNIPGSNWNIYYFDIGAVLDTFLGLIELSTVIFIFYFIVKKLIYFIRVWLGFWF
jgi:hypothetical protein